MAFKHTVEFDTLDARYFAMYLGEVVANSDPEGLGRIRVLVPGLLEPESAFAFPIGAMFGVKNGIHWVPEVGANVLVFFNQGDVDHPYYVAGPFGSPDGASDVPEQAPSGSVDHVVFRWRDFHVTVDGTSGSEKLTIEDLTSGTKLEIDRTTGDYLRDVEGSEVVNVKTNRDVTVEEGDETHTVTLGDRTTTVQGDDSRTVVTGDDDVLVSVGNRSEILTLGNSTESMPAGLKAVTAGLSIALTAGTTITILAGGAVSISGAGVTIDSLAGASNYTSGGLMTGTFNGGVAETVVGAVVKTITGTFARTVSGIATWTLNGIATFLGAAINLGLGPTYKAVLNSDMIAAFNAHTHGGVTAGGGTSGVPSTLITPGGTAPFRREDMESANVNAS